MEKSAILSADFLDIVFEGRNKEYGAYELRRTYNKRLRVSVGVMLSVTLLLCIGQLLASGQNPDDQKMVQIPDDVNLQKVDVEEPPPPPIPPPPPPPQQQIQSVQFTKPLIVDEDVPEDQKPPENDDLEDVKIDVKTQDGEKDLGIVAPPPDDNGKGILVPPKPKEEEPDIYISVQIESAYPGGRAAWERFLHKNLHYPQQAQDDEIEGMVVVQFVVDLEGNVSQVQAISGPPELRDEAIRVIKKSGKWTPAIQNGRQVPSYKKQPIGFQLMKE